MVSRTLCILGDQSDTLYTWWSVGHFVYLVVSQTLCIFGGQSDIVYSTQKFVVHILTLNTYVRETISVSCQCVCMCVCECVCVRNVHLQPQTDHSVGSECKVGLFDPRGNKKQLEC